MVINIVLMLDNLKFNSLVQMRVSQPVEFVMSVSPSVFVSVSAAETQTAAHCCYCRNYADSTTINDRRSQSTNCDNDSPSAEGLPRLLVTAALAALRVWIRGLGVGITEGVDTPAAAIAMSAATSAGLFRYVNNHHQSQGEPPQPTQKQPSARNHSARNGSQSVVHVSLQPAARGHQLFVTPSPEKRCERGVKDV